MELLRRYSNRPELVEPLRAVLKRLKVDSPDASPEGNVAAVTSAPSTVWRLRDRLTEAQVEQLIAEYQAGATLKQVAARYGLGMTTIKRLLRRRRSRRCDS